MGKIAEKIYDRFFGKKAHRRTYAAAKLNRQNADWVTRPTSTNWELRQSLFVLRARARQMARDNSHFKKYLSMCRSNIIGPKGIRLQSNARSADGSLNVDLNKQVENAWRDWGHHDTCTVSGKLSWRDVQRLCVTHLARDGEFLVQKIAANNDFGFSLKVWNVDYLDEMYNDTFTNGNRVIMSVEIDTNDRPVAYWLTTPASDIMFTQRRERTRTRVSADQMIHGFLVVDDETQARGVTWFSAAMLNAKHYQGYTEGVVLSARFTANSFGILTEENPDGEEYTGHENDKTGKPELPEVNISPGAFTKMPPGITMQQFDPKQPTQNHSAFAKTVLTDFAAGLDVPYFNLSGDMEAVNFSSSRVGLDDSRDIWRALQDFVGDVLCRDVFHAFARSALLTGKLAMDAKAFLEVQNPKWVGRAWKYIDPVKDVAATISELENHLTTWTDAHAEKGEDLVDYLERRQSEIELAKKYGIELVAVSNVRLTETGEPATDDATGAKAQTTTTKTAAAPSREYANGDAELVN